ncbi:TPA: hypothetical protein N0F65_012739 [Lagenidium giganteum]|uniref:Uncharacterized protein n=1 Tax=Lagenidium giganteum TaxID=4803 RepID=A0AAV2YHH4_9STRA|nr:TPA: hypothetical protein N0F65_012739 [Lagenidium giganteum]
MVEERRAGGRVLRSPAEPDAVHSWNVATAIHDQEITSSTELWRYRSCHRSRTHARIR